jgi:hypothetical protein
VTGAAILARGKRCHGPAATDEKEFVVREVFRIRAGARVRAASGALVAALALTALLAAPAEAKPDKRSVPVTVMTRNLFLGADLSPALGAGSFGEFVQANGAILREVDQTNFPVRAQGLAAEIKRSKAHLVGLQEVALWRTGPVNLVPAQTGQPVATDVKYDFLQLLLDQLNANKTKKYKGYEAAVVQPEFDFEAPANYDGDPNTGVVPLGGADLNGRLTMRDVILVRKGSGVKVTNPIAGHFQNLFTPSVAGMPIPVTRGWTALDAKVTAPAKGKGGGKGHDKVKKSFRFVNTHFEAFDDETQVPSIRALQAQELLAGPANANKVIVVGDLNSNVPGVKPGDEQAYQVMLDGGFTERSTSNPLSCCVSSVISGNPAEFDHQVDHIMTNESKKKVKLRKSVVTGLEPVNGFFDSDHAGIFSKLIVR